MATSTDESISQRELLENQYDKTVRDEIETFRTKALSFLAGDITEDAFRPFRLKHGMATGPRCPAGGEAVRVTVSGSEGATGPDDRSPISLSRLGRPSVVIDRKSVV